MAFEGHQSMFASAFFHQYQHQQASSIGSGSTSSTASSFGSIHSASKNQDSATYVPWSLDEPRKLADSGDWDGETDLLGLVSNIVDEAESPDSYFTDGILPACSSVWSPKSFKEGALQQQNHSFFSNCKSHDGSREPQLQSVPKEAEESSQLPNGLAPNQSWLLNVPNGGGHSVRTQRAPPGFPVPNAGGVYRPQAQQSKYDRSSGHPPDLSDVYKPQTELTSSYFDPFYEDPCTQSGVQPTLNEVNQLVSSFQSLMPPEESAGCLGGFSNKQRETVGMNPVDDGLADQWSAIGSAPSKQSPSLPQRFVGDFQPVLRESNGGMRERTLKREAFQDDLTSETAEFFQQPKSCFAPRNLPNQYQKKMPVQRENSDYFAQCFYLSQMQNNMKLQMPKGKMKTHTSGFQGGGFSGRAQSGASSRAGDRRSHSQLPYFDFQGNVLFPKFEGENGFVSAGIVPQFTPAVYATNDSRRHPFSSASRFPLAYGNGFPGVMAANDAAAFGYFAQRGENVHRGPGSQGRSSIQFLLCVDECYEQWRCLEKERRMTEAFLMKKPTAASNTNPTKPATNSSIIDQLIVNQRSEQNKVSSLLDTIERVHQVSLRAVVHAALSGHQKAICVLQASFKEDMAIMSKPQQHRACFPESTDAVVLMDAPLKELTAATRRLRTALWCALQMTVPQPVQTQERRAAAEAGCRERVIIQTLFS